MAVTCLELATNGWGITSACCTASKTFGQESPCGYVVLRPTVNRVSAKKTLVNWYKGKAKGLHERVWEDIHLLNGRKCQDLM